MYTKQRRTATLISNFKAAFLSSLSKCICILVCSFFSVFMANAQMSFKELARKQAQEKRPMVIYVSSKYCVYCLMQEAKVRKDKKLSEKLNEEYYFVKGNAEKDTDIPFHNQHFVIPDQNDSYAVNEFVKVYGKNEEGMIAYPLWLFFDKDYQLLMRFQGLMQTKNILKALDLIEKGDAQIQQSRF